MNARIFTLLVVSFIPGAFCLVMARLVLNTYFLADYSGLIDALLYLALAVCVFVAAITNFRDENGVLFEITLLENARIPKLHLMIGFFLIPLMLLNGITILDRSKVRISEKSEIVERLEDVRGELSEGIRASRDSFLVRLSSVSSELSDSVGTSKDSVVKRLNGVGSELSKKIERTKKAVLNRMSAVKKELSKGIEISRDSMLVHVNAARSALSDSVGTTRDSVLNRLDDLEGSLVDIDSLIRCCGY